MLFRRLFFCALLAGLLSGLLGSAVQRWQVVPLILAAEALESAAGAQPQAPALENGVAHSHGPQAWAPQDGPERTAYTVLANVLSASGSALLLLALMGWRNLQQSARGRVSGDGFGAVLRHGLGWGVAAWFSLFALPALGLPPELPAMQGAPLQDRQLWWTLAALCGAAGLATLCLARLKWRVLGLGLLVLPFAVGAPQPVGGAFEGLVAGAAAQMQLLATQFAVATAVASALQWLLLGTLCAFAMARWVSPLMRPAAQARGVPGPAR